MSPIDVGIISIREDEYKAVLDRLKCHLRAERHRTYAIADVQHRSGIIYKVGVVRCVEAGPNAGQDTARDLIEDLDPQWLAVVGIGGAVPSPEFTLGDVVVASRLHDFVVSASFQGASPQFANQGGPMSKAIQDLVASLEALRPEMAGWQSAQSIKSPRPSVDLAPNNFYGSDEWREKTLHSLDRYFGISPLRSGPEIIVRSIASSGTLIKDTAVIQTWQTTARDLAVVEMELGGVYSAARRKPREYPILAVRGISDIVGFKRSPEWTQYACDTAAAALIAILQNLPENVLIPRRVQLTTGEARPVSSLGHVETRNTGSDPGDGDRTPVRDSASTNEQPNSGVARLALLRRFGTTWRDLLISPTQFFSGNPARDTRYTNPWLFYAVSLPLLDFMFSALFLILCLAVDSEMPIGTWKEVLGINRVPSLVPLISIIVMSVVISFYGIHSGRLQPSRPLRIFYESLGRFLYTAPASTLIVTLSIMWLLGYVAFIFVMFLSSPPAPLSTLELLDLMNHQPTFLDTVKDWLSWAWVILAILVGIGPLLVSSVLYPTFAIRGFLSTSRLRAWIFAIVLASVAVVVTLPINTLMEQMPLSESERNVTQQLRAIKTASESFKNKNGRYGSLVELRDFSRATVQDQAATQNTPPVPANRDALDALKSVAVLNLQVGVSGYQFSFRRSKRFAYVDAIPITYSSQTRLSFVLDCALGVAHASDRQGARATILDHLLALAP